MPPMQLNGVMISVIIPHLNQPDGLETCLRSLDAQTLDSALFEIIVVDNGSAMPPEEVVARHAGVRLLHEPRPGPGPARNTGAESANGDIFAFIDADCRADSDWTGIRRGSIFLRTGTTVGLVLISQTWIFPPLKP